MAFGYIHLQIICSVLLVFITKSEQRSIIDHELEYVLINETSPCRRPCDSNSPPMVCQYKFTIEWYYTMSKACYNCPYNLTDCYRPDCIPADGVNRAVLTINRQLPGTSIEVCKGDLVIVDIDNQLQDESTTIHWHGQHQYGTPYMDGAPMVTQCPILPKTSFRYQFHADVPGTHWWHSHSGLQRGDGAFGSFIVHVPNNENPHIDLYDYDLTEHQMIILDWEHKIGIERFHAHHHGSGDNKPPSMLVNGLGAYKQFPTENDNDYSNETRKFLYTPVAKFNVEQDFRYRFRMINAGYLNCPIEVSVDNHTLLVISTDGSDVQPIEVNSLVIYAGERFDFVLNANESIDNYWIRYKGLMDCDERFRKVHTVAILHYEGAADDEYPTDEISYELAHTDGLQLNTLNVPENKSESVLVSKLQSLQEDDISLKEKPDFQFHLAYDFYTKDNPHFHRPNLYGFNQVVEKNTRLLTPQLNHISMKLPPFALLLSRDHLDNTDLFCNETTVSNCDQQYCECPFVYQVPLNSVVELVLIDKGFAYDANHPFHLHGHSFRVVGMDKLGKNLTLDKFQEYDRIGKIKRNLSKAPIKDTVTVPDGGYTILRFQAKNPGYWLFHCHIEWHVEIGMMLVFKIGEHNQYPPIPEDFPRCYDWRPRVPMQQSTTTEQSSTTVKLEDSNFVNSTANTNETTTIEAHTIFDWFHTNNAQRNTMNSVFCLTSLTLVLFYLIS